MKSNKLLLITVIGIFASSVGFLYYCKKIEPPKAIIIIVDSLDYKINNVMVVVFAGDSIESGMYINPNENQVADTAYTDATGKVEFEFANEAIFKVYAEKTIAGSVYYGEKVLVLENNKTEEKTIVLEKKL